MIKGKNVFVPNNLMDVANKSVYKILEDAEENSKGVMPQIPCCARFLAIPK